MELISLFKQINSNRYFQSIFKINVVLTTIGAIVADVLTPIAPMGLYVSISLACITFLLFILTQFAIFESIAIKSFDQYWKGPVYISLVLSTIMIYFAYYFAETNAPHKGYLATEFKILEKIQQDIGLIQKQTAEIAINTKKIAENTQKINITMGTLKSETSANPRKEIANMGLKWNSKDFVDVLKSGDINLIELFLQGGMKASDRYNAASAILYSMQPTLNNKPVDILKLFIKYGFNINEILFDAEILKHWSSSLPPYYLAENKPQEYSAYKNQFSGPLLMWMVILTTYRGATQDNLDVIKYIVSNGAELEITLAYLDFSKSWLENTSPYHEIRDLLK